MTRFNCSCISKPLLITGSVNYMSAAEFFISSAHTSLFNNFQLNLDISVVFSWFMKNISLREILFPRDIDFVFKVRRRFDPSLGNNPVSLCA